MYVQLSFAVRLYHAGQAAVVGASFSRETLEEICVAVGVDDTGQDKARSWSGSGGQRNGLARFESIVALVTWAAAAMASDKLLIPKLCPNCMRPAEKSWRSGYKLGNTTYFGTFYYCPACSAMMERASTTNRLAVFLSLLLVTPCAFALGAIAGLEGYALLVELISVPIVFGLGVWWLRRRPIPDGAITRRFAAFYTGKAVLGVGMKLREEYRFIALRDEWLTALVDLNPADTDPDEYLRRKGQPRPFK